MVSQVLVVGVLMIVNGALSLLFGIFIAVMGPVMFTVFEQAAAQQGGPPMPAEARGVFTVISIVYVVLGSLVAAAGILNIAGGIRAIQFRSRTLVITALFLNIIPVFTFYCALTSLGVMIYGLIVLFQADVAHAFELGASGYTAEEIRRRMAPGARYPEADRDRPRRGEDSRLPEEPSDKAPPPAQGPKDEGFYER
jgi:hypothetical protein